MSTTLVDEEFRQRLRLIMQQFGSVADLARAVGVSDNAIYKWVSGRGQPSMMSLVNLSKAAGVSVEWLATGRGAPTKAKGESRAQELVEVAPLARPLLRTANGRGTIENPQIVDYVSFQTEWLQRTLNVDLRNLALVEVIGDSMSPTIDEGDLVMVDLREVRFRSDGVYVLRTSSDLAVKRLQRQPDGGLLIRSDNPAYESSTVKPDEVALLGRVVWIGGRL
jgi:phage repressor protein C with HTH and peptisase S24 domain